MENDSKVIEQTKKWIVDVVIACNFCPFAAREIKRNSIHYEVVTETNLKKCLQLFINECQRLDSRTETETSLLIFSKGFFSFDEYLVLLREAEKLLKRKGYEGVYQLASFHPHYRFAAASAGDAANYTNRSPYPMLHLLKEESIEKALQHYPNPEQIPERNIQFAREKGPAYMKMLRDSCL
ncbi:DUF1415 domain-containing protein [Terrimonas alba]|uniref:DUF1415 domain-containing protein n=1 Tax=Terrimonas alba TaxID=3349636 RepID=UPI0035F2A183